MGDWKTWLGLLGGIGGALLTFLAGRLTAYRERPTLLVQRHLTDFALPFEPRERLKLSYRGKDYDSLFYAELTLSNSGSKMVQSGSMHVTLDAAAEIVSSYSTAHPENLKRTVRTDPDLPSHKTTLEFGGLRPGDHVRYGFLISGKPTFTPEYRGDPSVRTLDAFLSSDARVLRVYALMYTAMTVLYGTMSLATIVGAWRAWGRGDLALIWITTALASFTFIGTVAVSLYARSVRRRHLQARDFIPLIATATHRIEAREEASGNSL
jgi:hypothetical protein